ncbi:hypothetical protein [Emticicia sp. C21]|uniref:hypothetical protein n=1 Tax=Emticicia sp. C21 TaxID=2302915 RepID=UPI000E356A71|nr:hypothetical protein [Emticicia sp. C21]RFS16268.1 hypothetical protein D0T08_11300 [Emticicia sp. C21]
MIKEFFEEIEASDDFLNQLDRQIKPQIEAYFDYIFNHDEIRLQLKYNGFETIQKRDSDKKYIIRYEGNISKITVGVYFGTKQICFPIGIAWIDPYYRFEIKPKEYLKSEPILFWIMVPFNINFLEDMKKIIRSSKTKKYDFGKFKYALNISSLGIDITMSIQTIDDNYEILTRELSSIMSEWNTNAENNITGYKGLIHYAELERGPIPMLAIAKINLGTAEMDGLKFILKKINKLEISLTKVEIASM